MTNDDKKKSEKKADEPKELDATEINLESQTRFAEVLLESISPILPHQFAAKARRQLALKHAKREKKAKEIRDPVQEAVDALYVIGKRPQVPAELRNLVLDDFMELMPLPFLKGCVFGHPAAAFKHALARIGKTSDFKMVDIATSIFIEPHVDRSTGAIRDLIALEFSGTPLMRCDPVTVGNTTDLRYRCELHPWQTRLIVRYNSGFISLRQLAKLFVDAGDMVGVADWRPEKYGVHGRFRVLRIRSIQRPGENPASAA